MKTWEDAVREEFKKLRQLSQSQDGLNEQLAALIPFANKLGLYDAADHLTRITQPEPNCTRHQVFYGDKCVNCGGEPK